MKTRPAILLLCALCCCPALRLQAQVNLVPNFSFEQFDTCPNSEDQVHFATEWSKYSTSLTTPDYYNACAPATTMGVPKNSGGFQAAHRNCNAYMGLITYHFASINYREQIGVKLIQPLMIGQQYFMSFYTVLGEASGDSNYYGMPSNNIGIRLSTIPYNPVSPAPIDNFAHLYLPTVLNDTINWTLVSGSFIADSAYKYMIIGNFFDDANTDTVHWSCSTCQNWYGYFLIDDICISTDSSLCNGGIDTIPCYPLSINEAITNKSVIISPNPIVDVVTISFMERTANKLIIYNAFGQKALSKKIEGLRVIALNLSSFTSGIYFLELTFNEDYNQSINKIIKL